VFDAECTLHYISFSLVEVNSLNCFKTNKSEKLMFITMCVPHCRVVDLTGRSLGFLVIKPAYDIFVSEGDSRSRSDNVQAHQWKAAQLHELPSLLMSTRKYGNVHELKLQNKSAQSHVHALL